MQMKFRIAGFSLLALAGAAGLLALGLGGSTGENRGLAVDEHEARERTVFVDMSVTGDIQPLEQILHNARQEHSGRVLEAELKESSTGPYYEVEILDVNGEVWEMNFDARRGTLLVEEQEE
jgi:uncharacterized membrane protein YkoI